MHLYGHEGSLYTCMADLWMTHAFMVPYYHPVNRFIRRFRKLSEIFRKTDKIVPLRITNDAILPSYQNAVFYC